MANRLSLRRFSRWAVGQSLLRMVLAIAAVPVGLALAANTDFSTAPTWQRPTAEVVWRELEIYLQSSRVSPERQQAARDLWSSPAEGAESPELLDRLANSLAQVDDRVAQVIVFCAHADRPVKLPDFAWLADSQTPALVRFNMRLYYARWLAENNFDDEALSWTDGISVADVVAPEALLFYRAIANHRLVHADQADVVLTQLLERPDDLPARYQKLAVLMQKDLAGLDDESLDHISRRMADVRRRLALGRTGKTVQGVENGVIESLDKMIKKAEDQAQQQAQSASASGGQPSGTPMQDSHLAELKAPGKVDRRDIGHGADWGNMNDKDREQALQEIGREFPSHYREVIEEYFKQLATEPGDENHDGNGK
jgi:hypothetical protein